MYSNHILECLNNAIDNREEGVVIKRAESHYSPGQRNAGWFKIKPDVIEKLFFYIIFQVNFV